MLYHLANKSVDVDHIQVAYCWETRAERADRGYQHCAVFCARTRISGMGRISWQIDRDKQKVHTPGFIGFVLGLRCR